jgi:diguanylate cyclase (GGDEF)-like protein
LNIRLGYSLVLCVMALLGFLLSFYCAKRRGVAGAREFAAFIAACSIYAGSYAAELWGESLGAILAIVRVAYIGIALIPTCWLFFVLPYTGRRLPRSLMIISVTITAITLLLVNTLPWHHLFYIDPHLDLSGPFPTLAFSRGPWYWVQSLYTWAVVLYGLVLLLLAFLRASSVFKRQLGAALVCALLPFASNTAYLLGLVPNHLDPTPATFPLFALPLALSLLRFRFLDLMPIARERVLESIEDGVIVVDNEGRVVDTNPAARAMLGIGREKAGFLLGQAARADYGLGRLLEPAPGASGGVVGSEAAEEEGAGPGREGLGAGWGGAGRAIEFSAPAKEGERLYRARAFPIAGERGGRLGQAILVTDITEASRLLARLDELASRDSLTGLLNRRRFFELALREFELARRTGRQLSLCIADLDLFKEVNDSHGHDAGDRALRETAKRFASCLRSTDILCRYGGEEFAILFPECDAAEAASAAERIRSALVSAPMPCEDGEVHLSASFGVFGAVPAPGEDLDLFLRRADTALYAAKAGGRNLVSVARS